MNPVTVNLCEMWCQLISQECTGEDVVYLLWKCTFLVAWITCLSQLILSLPSLCSHCEVIFSFENIVFIWKCCIESIVFWGVSGEGGVFSTLAVFCVFLSFKFFLLYDFVSYMGSITSITIYSSISTYSSRNLRNLGEWDHLDYNKCIPVAILLFTARSVEKIEDKDHKSFHDAFTFYQLLQLHIAFWGVIQLQARVSLMWTTLANLKRVMNSVSILLPCNIN